MVSVFFISFSLYTLSSFKVGLWCSSVGINDSGTTAVREYRRLRNAQLPQTRTQNFAAGELPG